MAMGINRPAYRAISRPISRAIGVALDAFSPLSLFAAGEQGAWYDPSDLSTLFQDAAGTTPVTAAGQPVGLMRDKSGRGNHASQVTAGSRPILRNSGALWYLQFDGADDFLVTGNIDLSATTKIGAFFCLRKISDSQTHVAVEFGPSADSTDGTFALLSPSSSGVNKFDFRVRGSVNFSSCVTTSAMWSAPVSVVATGQADLVALTSSLRLNGASIATSAIPGTLSGFSVRPLYIGRRNGTANADNGNLYGLIIRGALTDATGITNTEKYLAAKSGVTL